MSEPRFQEEIQNVRAYNLFGRFDHNIAFGNETSDIAILTAPNGYGKTALLRMVDALFSRRLVFFQQMPCRRFEVSLKSGKLISVYRAQDELFENEEVQELKGVRISASGFGGDDETYEVSPTLQSSDIRLLERHLPVNRTGPEEWFDYQFDETLSTDQVITRYSDELPKRLLSSLKLPEWLRDALSSVQIHLVETQRLLSLERDPDAPRYRRGYIRTKTVVEKDASDLSARIKQTLRDYANEAQKLDESFPKRIIEFRGGSVSSEIEIRSQLEGLSAKRNDLVSVGLLDRTVSAPIEPTDIFEDESIRRILSIHIDDTNIKLSIFDSLYEKISLFKKILDEHFSFKNIVIDADAGIKVFDEDSAKEISLPELSSGEQHELVLIYELLFSVEEGSLILIDEPELSLHVAWQKRFISDIQNIQGIKKFNVIIATHSPQIINDKWDLVQELNS